MPPATHTPTLFYSKTLFHSVALTSPLAVSIGCLATIPVSAITDMIIYNDNFFDNGPLPTIGTCLVVLAFALLTTADHVKRADYAIDIRCCRKEDSTKTDRNDVGGTTDYEALPGD